MHMCRVGQNHIPIYGVYLNGNLGRKIMKNLRSYTVHIYGSGQPDTYDLIAIMLKSAAPPSIQLHTPV